VGRLDFIVHSIAFANRESLTEISGILARRLPSRAGYFHILLHCLRRRAARLMDRGVHGDDEFPRAVRAVPNYK